MSFVIYIVCIIGLMISIFYRIKVGNTGKMFFKVVDAISDYNRFQIRNNGTPDNNFKCDHISYDCVTDFYRILLNPFDWSYKNIVPSDVLKKIEPFMNEYESEERTEK